MAWLCWRRGSTGMEVGTARWGRRWRARRWGLVRRGGQGERGGELGEARLRLGARREVRWRCLPATEYGGGRA